MSAKDKKPMVYFFLLLLGSVSLLLSFFLKNNSLASAFGLLSVPLLGIPIKLLLKDEHKKILQAQD